jgi:hypothetical protein
MSETLTLLELESFDPQSPRREGERRFLCPLCGGDKPRDSAHRSFCLNASSGLWNCKRCGAKGQLKEFWPEKERGRAGQERLKRAFEVPLPPPEAEEKTDWRAIWSTARDFEGTPGQAYLERRGISLEIAALAAVHWVPSWHGRGALCFPFHDAAGQVVAIAGRTLQNGGLDKPAAGPKKRGAFWAPAQPSQLLIEGDSPVIICEAPFDALSLAQAGHAALALGGTSAPPWLDKKLAFRRVLLAFDADAAGDAAAEKVGHHLATFGAQCLRLRPQGAKDWNELLESLGTEGLREFLGERV